MGKRRLLAVCLIASFVLCSCGKDDPVQEQNITITDEEEDGRYEAVEIEMPDPLRP